MAITILSSLTVFEACFKNLITKLLSAMTLSAVQELCCNTGVPKTVCPLERYEN